MSLAIDFVAGAVDHTFDVGIIFSTDTDLVPAFEFVANRPGLNVVAEVVVWRDHSNAALAVRGTHLWCHRLLNDDYLAIRDRTLYAR